MDKLFGNNKEPTKMPSKKFKEDEDDFFDSKFFNATSKDAKLGEVAAKRNQPIKIKISKNKINSKSNEKSISNLNSSKLNISKSSNQRN